MKNSDSLKNKLEIIDSFIGSTTDELKILEENIKKIEGFSFGAKDLADKFKGHVKKTQSEIIDLLNEQKITQPIANLLNSSLLGSLKFVKEGAIEADRIFYVRQGEILGIKTRIKKLISLDSLIKQELLKAEKEENVVKPPKKPVITNSRHCGDSSVCILKKAIAIPMRYPPMRLAAMVPIEIATDMESNIKLSAHLNTAPIDAPRLMAKIELNISYPCHH